MVVTSSVAACSGGFDVGGQYTEEDWTDPKNQVIGAYVKSKVRLKSNVHVSDETTTGQKEKTMYENF